MVDFRDQVKLKKEIFLFIQKKKKHAIGQQFL